MVFGVSRDRPRMVVLAGVRYQKHGRVRAAPLHLLPRRAALRAAASVVPSAEKKNEKGIEIRLILENPNEGRSNAHGV